MARYFSDQPRPGEGSLILEQIVDRILEIKYRPSAQRVALAHVENPPAEFGDVRLLTVDAELAILQIFPLITIPNKDFLSRKFPWLESISLAIDSTMDNLPETQRDVTELLEGP